MSSPDVADSGRFPGQKSNFSQTCTRLSQYLKGRGSFGDLSLGISRNSETSGVPPATQTMNLLPMIEKSGHGTKPMSGFTDFGSTFNKDEANQKIDSTHSSVARAEPEKSQMTIFYGGEVFVFNDFPAQKAEEILSLARQGNNTQNPNIFSYKNSTFLPAKPAECSATNAVASPAVQPITSDLPIARRHSLARFLEKRKDRIISKGPYQMGGKLVAAYSSKQKDHDKSWLGLGAHLSIKTEPHS
ncbi:unnamed protein product [Cuscuta epithymum]|uniref:Protein TIFY n=1 Tax=Cuscuta epithymum TaxID=186058 RepID=A0AAV0DP70_9ASTE|nr:unnamed protein product [Cuscuta epithymum]